MNSMAIFISALLMGVITFILRSFPTIVPRRWLESSLLKSLNYALPISVMMILILNSLSIPTSNGIDILAKIMALGLVLGSYIWWRNVFLSVAVGVASLNLILWLLGI